MSTEIESIESIFERKNRLPKSERVQGKAREEIDALIQLAWQGKLTEKQFRDFGAAELGSLLPEFTPEYGSKIHQRSRYVMKASWAVFTTEYLDSLGKLVEGKIVLDVGAGNGILYNLMRERGVVWHCIDLEKSLRAQPRPWVMVGDWRDAVEAVHPDVIFASWIDYTSVLDIELASSDLPLVIIGEGNSGCTGSEQFWQDHEDCISKPPKWFRDVPEWWGIHDYTYLVHWRGYNKCH